MKPETQGTQIALGTLYLIPTQLANPIESTHILPQEVIAQALKLDHFVVENAKSARAFLKGLGISRPLSEVAIVELNKHGDAAADTERWIAPLLCGKDVGLLSEAGAPAVADPGSLVVAAAHRIGARVRPLVGPSSILLALMASGLNGQTFHFHGYLPQDKAARRQSIQKLEKDSRHGVTQLFIETPYRNAAMLADLIATLDAKTLLCVAQDLSGSAERIMTQPISAWRKYEAQNINLSPAIFLLLAA